MAQLAERSWVIGNWSLDILWSLGIGHWSLKKGHRQDRFIDLPPMAFGFQAGDYFVHNLFRSARGVPADQFVAHRRMGGGVLRKFYHQPSQFFPARFGLLQQKCSAGIRESAGVVILMIIRGSRIRN